LTSTANGLYLCVEKRSSSGKNLQVLQHFSMSSLFINVLLHIFLQQGIFDALFISSGIELFLPALISAGYIACFYVGKKRKKKEK